LSKEQILKAYMKVGGASEEITTEIEKEFQGLIDYIMLVKKKSERGFKGKCTLENTEIIQSLITLCDIETGDTHVEIELRRVALKILRRTIENENKDVTTPAAEWESEDWEKYEFQVVERQEMMADMGFTKLICRIISNDDDVGIKEEAILSAIALLIGGNNKSQMEFCNYMMEDTENTFVLKLKAEIDGCFDLIRRTERKKNSLNQKIYTVGKKVEDMIDLFNDPEHPIVKQLEQQL
jgi:hypothetical protein